jgi:parallel beta-helix repeat protein
MRTSAGAGALCVALSLLGGCSETQPCDGVSGSCTAVVIGMSEAEIAAAFAQAPANSTIVFDEGTFEFTNSLTLSKAAGITVRGAGVDKTILDFKYQLAGADGIVQNNAAGAGGSVTFQDFTVRDTYGNGVKVVGATGVVMRRTKVAWTGSIRGPYGLYPVLCSKVLIEDSTVDGARDAGIYVGQSDHIVVRNNTSIRNVAGIEIENSFNADVYGNTVTDNTGGILVFDLPYLEQLGGHHVRVFNNQIHDNNRDNFASGGTVDLVPAGTGGFVMANHDVEVFGNTITGNKTGGFAIVSYIATGLPYEDSVGYVPLPARVYVHDNTFSNNGTAPDPNSNFGLLFLTAQSVWPGGKVSDVLYDGIVAPGATNDQVKICVQKNGSAGFANLNFAQLPAVGYDLSQTVSFDAAPYDCALPPLPEVQL